MTTATTTTDELLTLHDLAFRVGVLRRYVRAWVANGYLKPVGDGLYSLARGTALARSYHARKQVAK